VAHSRMMMLLTIAWYGLRPSGIFFTGTMGAVGRGLARWPAKHPSAVSVRWGLEPNDLLPPFCPDIRSIRNGGLSVLSAEQGADAGGGDRTRFENRSSFAAERRRTLRPPGA
jgi:hypothetical protein